MIRALQLIVLGGLAVASPPAHALEYIEWRDRPELERLNALALVVNTVNLIQADVNNRFQIYCPPPSLRFTHDQVESIVTSFATSRNMEGYSIELLVVMSMADAFPCR